MVLSISQRITELNCLKVMETSASRLKVNGYVIFLKLLIIPEEKQRISPQ